MSNSPNGITNTAHATRGGVEEHVSFHMFFDSWIVEQNHHLQKLVSASKEWGGGGGGVAFDVSGRSVLIPVVEQVVHHYEHYYKTKSMWAKKDILSMFSPTWTHSLEKAFMWVGGWRPATAIHLLYSKCGLQLEAAFEGDYLPRGLNTGDLGDLSHSQMVRVDELHKSTLWEEKMITEKLAKQQETIADSSMVGLTTELMIRVEEHDHDQQVVVDAALASKEKGLVVILQMADDLRLKTLKGLILILTPIQGVHFLIAAAELHLKIHEWGKNRDASRNHRRHHHTASTTTTNK
ncbi:hypothetical protein ABFS82_01G062800 [Erythranthe guttata]|uniref:DOG1 domain-containing protein n=1 Tax=Erythranthe guttata TaxID=4155 RepID=A0A022Q834_ERYGU|nr:hypothetical protein MIMGU_mgv1a023034mg [Erythranthe guttata]